MLIELPDQNLTIDVYPPGSKEEALTGVERAQYAGQSRRCGHRALTPTGGSWVCTLIPGHTGAHVGGYSNVRCGARWWDADTLLDLITGPDEGC